MSEIIRQPVRVLKVEERKERVHTGGFGDNATFEERSLGWWITLDNRLVWPIGHGRPDFAPGDACRLTLEKVS